MRQHALHHCTGRARQRHRRSGDLPTQRVAHGGVVAVQAHVPRPDGRVAAGAAEEVREVHEQRLQVFSQTNEAE